MNLDLNRVELLFAKITVELDTLVAATPGTDGFRAQALRTAHAWREIRAMVGNGDFVAKVSETSPRSDVN